MAFGIKPWQQLRYCTCFTKQFTALNLPSSTFFQVDAKSYCYCWTSFIDVVSESVWPAQLPPLCFYALGLLAPSYASKRVKQPGLQSTYYLRLFSNSDTAYCSPSLCLYFQFRKEWLVEHKTNDTGGWNLKTGTTFIYSLCGVSNHSAAIQSTTSDVMVTPPYKYPETCITPYCKKPILLHSVYPNLLQDYS